MEEETIRQDVYAVLHGILKNNISEVSGRVYSSYPKTKISLPLIIVEPAQVKKLSFLSNTGFEVTVTITVYSKKSSELDLLADKVDYSLTHSQVETLWQNKMYLLQSYDSNTADFEDLNNNAGHYKVLTYVFRVIR